MKFFYSWCLIFLVCGSVLADAVPNQGVFISVTGNVQVLKTNQQVVTAQKDLTVLEGDQIAAAADSTAVLRLFDGSEMKIAPNTQFTLTAAQKPSEQDKVIKFKLLIGRLWATVKKLTTAHSVFEIEAGGVVCGVRGTEFSISNDGGKKPNVEVQVYSGTVYVIDANGNHTFFKSGSMGHFQNGSKTDNGGNSNNSSNNGGKKGSGNSSNNGGTNGANNPSGTNNGSGNSSGNTNGSGNTTGNNTSSNNPTGNNNGTNNSPDNTGSNNSTGNNNGTNNSPDNNGTNNPSGNNNGSGNTTVNNNGSNNPTGNNNGTGDSTVNNGTNNSSDNNNSSNNPAGTNTGSGNTSVDNGGSLSDLGNQFQTTSHTNSNNNINSPAVQGAGQFIVVPRIGK